MKRRSKIIIIFTVALMLGVISPGSGVAAPPPKAAAPGAPPAPTAAESPFVFRFDPAGKPDPFKPFVDVEMALKKKKAEEQELLRLQRQRKAKEQQQTLSIFPLQRLALNQFKLVGIGGNERSRTAMVQDPSAKFYPLFIGTQIGLHGAKVVEIRESSVILEEVTQVVSAKSKSKRTEKKRIEMKLHQEGEEGKP